MEVNFSKMAPGWGVGRENLDATGIGAKTKAGEASRVSHLANGLTVTESKVPPEEISAAAIPESALLRDDALGMLVKDAFNLPPPPFPVPRSPSF